MDMRVFLPGQDMPVIPVGKQGQVGACVGGEEQAPEKLRRIKHNIGPAAFRSLVGVGGVGDIPGNTGDIPFFEGHGFAVKFHRAAVRVAEADFQTVVKMETAAGNIRYFPMSACKDKNRKVRRKIIVAVFHDSVFGFGHIRPPFTGIYNNYNQYVKNVTNKICNKLYGKTIEKEERLK